MSDSTDQFEAQHEEDRFTLLVEDGLEAYAIPDDDQMEQFESIYYTLPLHYTLPWEGDRLTAPLVGRTICVDFEPRHIPCDIVLDMMRTAIDKFFPGHTDVKQMPAVRFLHDIDLFQGKDANGTDVLFVFDTLEVHCDNFHISLIGPVAISEPHLASLHTTLTDYFRELEYNHAYYSRALQLCALLNKLREERTRELDRRTDLVELIALSLLDPDTTGLSSIGADNLAVVTQMLMRM